MHIEKIYTYPVKALRAVSLDSVQVTKHGFPHDRRFMILRVTRPSSDDDESKNITYSNVHIANTPESVMFHPSIDLVGEMVTITYKPTRSGEGGKETAIDFPLYPYTGDLELIEIEMHKSPTKAFVMHQRYTAWLSDCYGFEAVLAYLGPHYRPVLMSSEHGQTAPPPYPKPEESNGPTSWLSSLAKTATSLLPGNILPAVYPAQVTFADVAPYLIVSSTSITSLNDLLPDGSEMDILKFRPNIIVSGADEAWEEDYWGELTITTSDDADETLFSCVHNCGRCASINIDYDTGKMGKGPTGEMLKRMQKDRRVDPGVKYSPVFGRYSFLEPGSEGRSVRVGDKVVVSKRMEERTRFDWAGLST